jgi:hypothetical protein
LALRGLKLPTKAAAESIDYQKLASILMTPDTDTPPELIDALYYVHEMSTDEGMDALLNAAAEHSLALSWSEDQSPADVAVQMWVLDPEVVQEKHAEQFIVRTRSFECFHCSSATPPKIKKPTDRVRRSLERDLDEWFQERRRGRGVRVFPFPKDDGVWFLIRHGSPYRREESIENGKPSSVHYRPVKYDVLVYDVQVGEIRIHSSTPSEKSLYRGVFGKRLFGDPACFPDTAKYDLAPLRRDGKDSLLCGDVPGMDWARLREIHFYWGGAHGEIECRKAGDLFAVYEARGRKLPESPRIIRASFEVKFKDSRQPRVVTIKAPNIALYTRDSDSALIEDWLSRRGFIRAQEHAADAAA